MPGGVEQEGRLPAPTEHRVQSEVGLQRVTGLGQVAAWREQDDSGGQREPFVARPQDQRNGQVASGRRAAHDDVLRPVLLEHHSVGEQAIVEGRREGVVRRHAVVDRPYPSELESVALRLFDQRMTESANYGISSQCSGHRFELEPMHIQTRSGRSPMGLRQAIGVRRGE
jgi:hypothetical protein